jgi:hypothetical protein
MWMKALMPKYDLFNFTLRLKMKMRECLINEN